MRIEKIHYGEAIEILKSRKINRVTIGNGRTYPAELSLVKPAFDYSDETFVIVAINFKLKLPMQDIEDILLCRAISSMFIYSMRGEVYQISFEKPEGGN
jgi:hypothetical protein